jgi:CheY-like chemotaxis protein
VAGQIRLLVVDDSPDLRDLICLLLDDEADIDVVGQAADGADAVQLVGELTPDVVLMDVAMPVMSGLEAMAQVRQIAPTTRVVLLSAYPREAVNPESVAGADDYIDKSVIVSDLVDRLRVIARRPAKGATGGD